jgi:hypothetical protein
MGHPCYEDQDNHETTTHEHIFAIPSNIQDFTLPEVDIRFIISKHVASTFPRIRAYLHHDLIRQQHFSFHFLYYIYLSTLHCTHGRFGCIFLHNVVMSLLVVIDSDNKLLNTSSYIHAYLYACNCLYLEEVQACSDNQA